MAETVGAFGQHPQGAQVPPEDQPNELQHQKQRGRHDLKLLDKLFPQAVVRLDGRHPRIQLSVANPAGCDINTFFGNVNGSNTGEPTGRVQHVGFVLCDQFAALFVHPLNQVEFALGHLLFDQLVNRRVFTNQRLVGNEWRDEAQCF